MQEIILEAPLSGIVYPIESVPDPVFSQKMAGDGLSIDPTSHTLYAPLDGTVTQLHSAGHAVTVRHGSGLEVMMHIGLDTVALKSKGFRVYAKEGQRVKRGDPLIDFDMDYLALHAKSLMTQIIFPNDTLIDSIEKSEGVSLANETILMTVILKKESIHGRETAGDKTPENEAPENKVPKNETVVSKAVTVHDISGIHARPAAALAALAKRFDADILLLKGEAHANAKSMTGIMGLDIKYQDRIQLSASGSDAGEAIDAIMLQIQSDLGEEESEADSSTKATETTRDKKSIPAAKSDDPRLLAGRGASPGVATGVAVHLGEEIFDFEEEAAESYEQKERLNKAIDISRKELEASIQSMHTQTDSSRAAILAAHLELLDDPELRESANRIIDGGKSAEYGWQHACTTAAGELTALGNKLLAERADDLRDIGKRVLRVLTGRRSDRVRVPDDAILIAEEITPSLMVDIQAAGLRGLCSTTGGTTSHVAIIARSLEIPLIVGMDRRLLEIPDGTPLILDGNRGTLQVNPSAALLQKTKAEQSVLQEERAKDLEAAQNPAVTTDGTKIEIVANIGTVEDAAKSIEVGGEGVGLLRSEFLFQDHVSAPTEEEQYTIYRDMLLALKGRPLLIRTLDVGGDKPLPYLPLPAEENPFLGMRGIRIGLESPEIFRVQARAILRAGTHGKIRIMFPMISTIDEIREVKRMLEEERRKLDVEPVETGIMIEVPSAAILADRFAREVDFFSIGTNDLTQYTLAIDRGHPKLAARADALDPAVLHLIRLTAEGAHREGKWVGICGGLASDPQAIPLLIGLAIDELSVTIPAIPQIKAEVRRYASAACRDLAQRALNCASAAEVRSLLKRSEEQR